jgi:hypothetical protein
MPVICFRDVHNRPIRLIEAWQEHFETAHPEMVGQLEKIQETLLNPDQIVRSRTDPEVELFYCRYLSQIPPGKFGQIENLKIYKLGNIFRLG